jgi:hypothetical protein
VYRPIVIGTTTTKQRPMVVSEFASLANQKRGLFMRGLLEWSKSLEGSSMLRSLLRFSIRDLFWLTVVAAIAFAWWVDHFRLRQIAAGREKAISLLFKELRPGYQIQTNDDGTVIRLVHIDQSH